MLEKKANKKKANKKAFEKLCNSELVLKDIEWPDQQKKKRELQVSLSLKKGPRTLHFSEIQISPKRKRKLIHYF